MEKPAGAANVSVFSELLDVGAADPDHVDSDGRSLLILAARNGHPRLVSVLAAAGADVNAADADFDDFGVAHHAAAPLSGANAGDAAGPRALRASVLSYFGGGLDARKAASAVRRPLTGTARTRTAAVRWTFWFWRRMKVRSRRRRMRPSSVKCRII